ncbi:hypothetical protein VP1G_11228 [Cytospora mali]|uniref:Uncharacterized protein n=1 Tax=Cytospora mali TaxID=578113 RepID=A0A194V9N2_CYTMA|nr:hypothetical protein VP1G_11228 [Valsa mali var. pyri (nom. inval.)]
MPPSNGFLLKAPPAPAPDLLFASVSRRTPPPSPPLKSRSSTSGDGGLSLAIIFLTTLPPTRSILTTCCLFSYSGRAFHSISLSSFCCLLSSRALSSGDAHRFPPNPAIAPDTSKSAASSLTVVRRAFCAWKPSSLSLCSLARASASLSPSLPVRGFVNGRGAAATQMTLPQLRQFGAAFCKGCLVATQLQRRAATSSGPEEDRDGFVVISRERMAASRSATAVEAPCMGVPPVMEILVVWPVPLDDGPGVELREVGFDLGFCFGARRSETSEPAADGGALFDFCWCDGGVEILGVDVLDGTLLDEGVGPPDRPPFM